MGHFFWIEECFMNLECEFAGKAHDYVGIVKPIVDMGEY